MHSTHALNPCTQPMPQGVKLDLAERVIELELVCYPFMDCAPAQGSLHPALARLPKLRKL